MPSSGDIKPLPSDVIAKIKSSTSIIHLNGVVVELVKNALDASARTVLISVDFKRGSCIVEDDGDGIPQAEFETDGGLGKAHCMLQAARARDMRSNRSLILCRYVKVSKA